MSQLEDWIDDALDEAAESANEALGPVDAEVPLGAILVLRSHKEGIAAAGALGLARIAMHVAAGDVPEARLEDVRSGHKARRLARRHARLAAHEEREDRDRLLGGLVDALEELGAYAVTQALPYLLRALDLEGIGL